MSFVSLHAYLRKLHNWLSTCKDSAIIQLTLAVPCCMPSRVKTVIASRAFSISAPTINGTIYLFMLKLLNNLTFRQLPTSSMLKVIAIQMFYNGLIKAGKCFQWSLHIWFCRFIEITHWRVRGRQCLMYMASLSLLETKYISCDRWHFNCVSISFWEVVFRFFYGFRFHM